MSLDGEALRVRNRGLRMASAVILGLMIEVVRGSALPPLAPVIALQLLAAMPRPPPLKLLVMLLGVSALAAAVSYAIAMLSLGIPGAYALGVGVTYLWCFWLVFTPGLGPMGVMALTVSIVVSALSAASGTVAVGVAVGLLGSILLGGVLIFLAHALFPEPPAEPEAPKGQVDPGKLSHYPVELRAILATLVILPLHLVLTADGVAAMVVLLTTATLLRQPGVAQSTQYAVAYASGNALGGVLAGVSSFFMMLHGNAVMMVAITSATALFMAWKTVGSPRLAPVFLPGFVAYVVLFGLTLSSLPLGDDVAVVQRVLQILGAAIYAFCAMSLVAPILTRVGFADRA